MKTRTLVTGLLATVIVSGCTVLSFYPLYTEKELVRDDRIIGEWQSLNNKDFYPTSENNTVNLMQLPLTRLITSKVIW